MARKPVVAPGRKSSRQPMPRVVLEEASKPKEVVEKKKVVKPVEKKGKKMAKKQDQGQKNVKSKPTYERMIKKAILAEQGEGDRMSVYVSVPRIAKFLEHNYPVGNNCRRYIKMALKSGVEKGTFIQRRASFRLSAKAQRRGRGRKRSSSRGRSPSRSKSPVKRKEKADRGKKKEGAESPKKKQKRAASKEKESPKKKQNKRESKPAQKQKQKNRGGVNGIEGGSAVEGKEGAPLQKNIGTKYDYMWQYEHNGWHNYDPKASDVVEEVYQGYLANRGDTDVRAVRSGQWEYQVDFMAMKQMNIQHENHTVRSIRRIKVV